MELKELKEKLYDFIQESRFKQAFELLKKEMSRESDKRNLLLNIRGQFVDYMAEKFRRNISPEEGKIEKSIISSNLVEFIDDIEQDDLGAEIIYKNHEITNNILVLTHEDKMDDIREFFLQLNFINAVPKKYSDQNYDVGEFDLVVFDNQDLPVCLSLKQLDKLDKVSRKKLSTRIEMMEDVIHNSSKFIIHFGNILYWVNSNRDSVHAANSKFSLHARTKEVVEFINTYFK